VAVPGRGSAQGWRPPLFCTNGVSGDILYCGPLARDLGSDQPIYGLQSRGLTGPPHLTIPDMARDYIKEVRSVQPGAHITCVAIVLVAGLRTRWLDSFKRKAKKSLFLG